MSAPSRDAVEFTAALILGTVLGAGIARLALVRRRSPHRLRGEGGESNGIAGTFLQAVKSELGAVLEESVQGRAPRASVNGGSA